jgi:serine/threonine-protein kinase
VWRQTLGTSDPPEILSEEGSGHRYAPTGHLVYGLNGRLVATRLSLDQALPVGGPTPIFDDVMSRGNRLIATWSDTGTLVYAPGSNLQVGSFVWRDRTGGREPIGLSDEWFGAFRLSPDGTQLAYTVRGERTRLWLHDLERDASVPLTGDDVYAVWPAWHSSGESLFFTRRGPTSFMRIDLSDRSKDPVEVIPNGALAGDYAVNEVLEDGMIYAYAESNDEPGQLFFVPFDEDGVSPLFDEQKRLTGPPGDKIFNRLSPDGRWIAYGSNESGTWEIYVASYPDLAVVDRVSLNGGDEPRWSSDGREIIYRRGLEWYSVAFADEPELRLGDPELVLSGPYLNVGGDSWDVSPVDGRFLVVENPDLDNPITRLVVVTNFFEELERLVPIER